jgi:peroxiredoxin
MKTKTIATASIAVSILAWAVAIIAEDPASSSSPRSELIELGKLVEAAQTKHFEAIRNIDGKQDFDAFLAASRKTSPIPAHGRQLIDFARQHVGTNEAVCALAHVIAFGDGDPNDPAYRYAEEAIELLGRNELHNDHFPVAAKDLSYSISTHAEHTLRRVRDKSQSPRARAAASQALIEFIYRLNQRARSLDLEPTGRNRDWIVQSYRPAVLKMIANRTPGELFKNAIELAESARKSYGDMPQPDVRRSGPNEIVLELTARDPPQTYGEIADIFLFDMRNLQEGCTVPDIEGQDLNGKQLRLSDYRGNVVLLMFTSNGCTPCAAMYTDNRKLIEQYRHQPFAVLGVLKYDTQEAADAEVEKGEINWRCWYDGVKGPITRRWNISGWPTVFLIDGKGTIRHRDPPDEKIGELVAELLRKRT